MKFRAQSSIASTTHCESSKSVSELFDMWERAETELSRIAHEFDALGENNRDQQKRLERQEDQLHDTQNAVILTLLGTPSRSVRDVLCKLKVWRSVTVPILGLDENRPPLERFALGAVEELAVMHIAPGEQQH